LTKENQQAVEREAKQMPYVLIFLSKFRAEMWTGTAGEEATAKGGSGSKLNTLFGFCVALFCCLFSFLFILLFFYELISIILVLLSRSSLCS
jgi:hypothetical protein